MMATIGLIPMVSEPLHRFVSQRQVVKVKVSFVVHPISKPGTEAWQVLQKEIMHVLFSNISCNKKLVFGNWTLQQLLWYFRKFFGKTYSTEQGMLCLSHSYFQRFQRLHSTLGSSLEEGECLYKYNFSYIFWMPLDLLTQVNGAHKEH